jgi:hypothetical protein
MQLSASNDRHGPEVAMAASVILTSICAIAVLFYLRFISALFRECGLVPTRHLAAKRRSIPEARIFEVKTQSEIVRRAA